MTLLFSVQCIIKQLLDSVFVISRKIKVSVTKNCCATYVKIREYANFVSKIREYANFVSNLLAYLISAVSS